VSVRYGPQTIGRVIKVLSNMGIVELTQDKKHYRPALQVMYERSGGSRLIELFRTSGPGLEEAINSLGRGSPIARCTVCGQRLSLDDLLDRGIGECAKCATGQKVTT